MENDPCACIWNHELAMRHLLSLLQQSQSVCADSECYDTLPPLPVPENGTIVNNGFFMFTMMWMALAFFLYLFRPASLRNTKNKKPFDHDEGNNNGGPSGISPNVH